jgi:hypothetical protein
MATGGQKLQTFDEVKNRIMELLADVDMLALRKKFGW